MIVEMSENELEYVKACPVCASTERAGAYGGFPPFAVVRCKGCGVYYLTPRFTEEAITSHYSDGNYFGGGGYTDYVEQEQALRLTFRRFLQGLYRRGLTGGSLLEIGCGYGYLLAEARGFFSRLDGTDFDPAAVEHATPWADQIFHGGLDAVPAEKHFDCIIAMNVIEHVYRPVQFISSMMERLAPGGRVVLATPDMGSFWRRLMGHKWPSFKIPEHVVFYDRLTLSDVMRRAGLQDVRPLPCPHAFPASVILGKLGFKSPAFLSRQALWLPRVMVAACGVVK